MKELAVMSHRITSAPNQSIVRGTIVALRSEPGGYGQTIELRVAESQDVNNLPNYTRGAIGRVVPFYLSESDCNLRPGDRIEGRVVFRGGVGGGRYNLLPDDLKII
jgi:hypothetical protein